MKRLLIIITFFYGFTVFSQPLQQTEKSPYENFNPGTLHPSADEETKFLGQLVGVWGATRKSRNQDGTWSDLEPDADWIWYFILNGTAIQDDWILPSLENPSEDDRFYGTNVRIYNSDVHIFNRCAYK